MYSVINKKAHSFPNTAEYCSFYQTELNGAFLGAYFHPRID